jgi:predicted MFS family arabinose efflux permease
MEPGFWRGLLVGNAVGLPLAALVALLDWDDRALFGVVTISGTIAALYIERYQQRRGIDPLH